jgi:hypothetical protein
VIGVDSRFDDPYDDGPIVPAGDDAPLDPPLPALPLRRGSVATLAWRGPLSFPAAARIGGGGIYVIEDANGQPAYVGQTASFTRRLSYLAPRFPRHRVRVARIAPPPVDVLRAVGNAVLRAARRLPVGLGPVRGALPPGHAYGTTPARGSALWIERPVRRIETLTRRRVA